MKTAIIILNYNDYNNTKKYVEDIKNYNVIDKIVIVDNNSIDNMFDNLKLFLSDKIDVIKSDKNGGYAYGNNYGLKYIDEKYGENYFDFVIISNSDISVEEEAIKICINELEKNQELGIVAPRMYFVNGPARRAAWKKRTSFIDISNSTRITEAIFYPIFKSGEYTKKDYEKEKLLVHSIAGSFFIARHSYFKEVGYFDENTFLFFEEDILGDKFSKKGYEIEVLNNIKFMHYESQTIGKIMNIFKKQNVLFDSRIYYHKNYNNASKFIIFIFEILRYIRKIELIFEVPILKFCQFLNKK